MYLDIELVDLTLELSGTYQKGDTSLRSANRVSPGTLLKQWGGFYLSVHSECASTLYAFYFGRILDRGLYDRCCVSTALIAGRLYCLPGLGCNASAFDRVCENLVGSNETNMEINKIRWRCPLKVKFWFETLVLFVFLHQIQLIWAFVIVVGSPIQCLFVLASLAIRWEV